MLLPFLMSRIILHNESILCSLVWFAINEQCIGLAWKHVERSFRTCVNDCITADFIQYDIQVIYITFRQRSFMISVMGMNHQRVLLNLEVCYVFPIFLI
jgi:hypothetical protein